MEKENTKKTMEQRLSDIRGGSRWHWLNAKIYYAQLIDRLEKYGVPASEVDDILTIALSAAIEDERWKK